MRLVVAKCSVDYAGRLSAHLPLATRLLLVKADGSVLVHSDSLSYKPLNWMSPPCTIAVIEPEAEQASQHDPLDNPHEQATEHRHPPMARRADSFNLLAHELHVRST